jgi:hypothetical protein
MIIMIHVCGDVNRIFLLFASNRVLARSSNVCILSPFALTSKGFFICITTAPTLQAVYESEYPTL